MIRVAVLGTVVAAATALQTSRSIQAGHNIMRARTLSAGLLTMICGSKAFATSSSGLPHRIGDFSLQAFADSAVSSNPALHRTNANNLVFINSQIAKDIDVSLMSVPGFSIDQLMELAGYSVAASVHDFSVRVLGKGEKDDIKVLILAGPGNNGGDGLVAARHLKHFGYSPTIVYAKKSNGTLFTNLVKQCNDLDIPVLTELPAVSYSITETESSAKQRCPHFGDYDIIVDALFGFSFHGPPKEPFATMISKMATTKTPVLSVDIPSGEQHSNFNLRLTILRQQEDASALHAHAPHANLRE